MNLEEYDFDRLLGLGYTEKATGELKDACWKGYTAVGTKKKGGREVPNCVPIKKSEHSESEDFRQIQMGGDLLVDVECDTNLPLSTPAELREAKMRKRVVAAQVKAQRQEAREQAKRAREAKRASRAAKKMQQGFAEEMKHKPLIAGPSAGSPSFAEGVEEVLDFARCQRSDGSHYGTSGTCRKGTQVKELEERIKRQEKFLRTSDPSKFTRKEIEIEKKELQRLKSELAGMKSTMRQKKDPSVAEDLAAKHAKEMGVSKAELKKVYEGMLKKNPDTDLGDLYQKAQAALKAGGK